MKYQPILDMLCDYKIGSDSIIPLVIPNWI